MTNMEIVARALENEEFKKNVAILMQVNPDLLWNPEKIAVLAELAKKYNFV